MSAVAAIVVAFGILVFFWRSRGNFQALPSLPEATVAAPADLTVIIPARNEASCIAHAVASFPALPVIVVDDHSTDDTVSQATEAGARVLSAPPLPAGPLGKPNACQAGAAEATTSWLLFVDADTWFEPAFVPSLLAYAAREKLDAVSVFPHQHCVSLAERVLLPYAFALYFTGVDARSVNSARSREALANGQCFLFHRRAYDAIGGHRAVASSVIEDIALARLLKTHRIRFRVLRTSSLAHVRMYTGFSAIWRGFQKNSFRFLLVNPATAVQVMLASIFATSWLPFLAWAGSQGEWKAAATLFASLFAALFPVYGRRVLYAPAAVYVFQAIALSSFFITLIGRKVVWKGRRV